MWTYRMYKKRLDGEDDAAALQRLAALPGVVAVEAVQGVAELAGAVYVRAEDVDDARAKLLLENPEALPSSVQLRWVDVGDAGGRDAVRDYLRDDDAAYHRGAERLAAERSARGRTIFEQPVGAPAGKGPPS